MGNLLILAIAAAFYPTLLAIVIVILTRPRPMRLFAAFLAGGMLMSVSIGIVIVLALGGEAKSGGGDSFELSPFFDLLGGVVMLALATVTWKRRNQPPSPRRQERKARRAQKRAEKRGDKEPWSRRMMAHDSIGITFGLGMLLNLPSAWYLIALKDIAEAHYSTVEDLLLILAFNLIMFILIEIPLVGYLVAPDRAREEVERFDGWRRRNARMLGVGLAAAAGVFLVIKGIVELV